MTENEIAKVVVDAAIEVHRTLGGPGLLETVKVRHGIHRGVNGLQSNLPLSCFLRLCAFALNSPVSGCE